VQQFLDYLNSLGDSPVSLWIAESTWAFPALEVVHIFAISMVFGTIAIIDLRLLGLASTRRPYSEMARELLPWTWGAFFAASICGSVLILSRPAGYFENTDFRLKFACMALAGVNMLVFQFIISKNLANWDRGVDAIRPHDRLHHGAGRRMTRGRGGGRLIQGNDGRRLRAVSAGRPLST
jgi:hypothetical protein